MTVGAEFISCKNPHRNITPQGEMMNIGEKNDCNLIVSSHDDKTIKGTKQE